MFHNGVLLAVYRIWAESSSILSLMCASSSARNAFVFKAPTCEVKNRNSWRAPAKLYVRNRGARAESWTTTRNAPYEDFKPWSRRVKSCGKAASQALKARASALNFLIS